MTRSATGSGLPRAGTRSRRRRCWTPSQPRPPRGGEAIGYDAGKRVRGRKRHLLVDTAWLVLRAVGVIQVMACCW